jgi:hypothetical protein
VVQERHVLCRLLLHNKPHVRCAAGGGHVESGCSRQTAAPTCCTSDPRQAAAPHSTPQLLHPRPQADTCTAQNHTSHSHATRHPPQQPHKHMTSLTSSLELCSVSWSRSSSLSTCVRVCGGGGGGCTHAALSGVHAAADSRIELLEVVVCVCASLRSCTNEASHQHDTFAHCTPPHTHTSPTNTSMRPRAHLGAR